MLDALFLFCLICATTPPAGHPRASPCGNHHIRCHKRNQDNQETIKPPRMPPLLISFGLASWLCLVWQQTFLHPTNQTKQKQRLCLIVFASFVGGILREPNTAMTQSGVLLDCVFCGKLSNQWFCNVFQGMPAFSPEFDEPSRD